MISLKINPYSEKEVQVMHHLLHEAERSLIRMVKCNKNGCKTCEFRHVCYALSNACEYLEKKILENAQKTAAEMYKRFFGEGGNE